MEDRDIVADRQPDGRFIIRRWDAATGQLMPINEHPDSYDEAETHRRLNELRATGDTYLRERSDLLILIQP